ncbi:MAG: RNA polymerase factor sigma-54 [Myxococcales bacterium]|nr:RNA polymerase factor sigma-54 [Myxococcales bacterium]
MALELKQQLRLTQQLVMTPQLQQAIKLLQMNRLELVNVVQQELEENPVLEEALEGDDEPAATGIESSEAAGEPAGASPEPSAEPAGEPAEEREPTDAEKIADIDWQNYMDAYPQTGMREQRDDEDRPSFEANLTRRTTLSEHLHWQLKLLSYPIEEEVAAAFIIGNLDDRGYLLATVEEVARHAGVSEEVVERALIRVQDLDPVGVGARDLRECMKLQIHALGIDDEIVHRIVDECFDALIRRDFRGVARQLGIGIDAVSAAAKVIGTLEPRPGRAFGGDEPIYIIPDIYVYKVGDELHIVLNDDGLPRLRISSLYRDVLARGSDMPKDTKTYVHDKVRSALWLIKSIHQRQRTIYKVMQSIIKYQSDFFDKGINHLKPLNLRDVADDIEMHESTVSRVTTNKYVNCPQGIFELKYFFNSGINRVHGDAVASESVKDRIGRLIRSEDARRPLSDQRIAEMLKVANIDIARRTVTKYRESLNILSSTKRREVG